MKVKFAHLLTKVLGSEIIQIFVSDSLMFSSFIPRVSECTPHPISPYRQAFERFQKDDTRKHYLRTICDRRISHSDCVTISSCPLSENTAYVASHHSSALRFSDATLHCSCLSQHNLNESEWVGELFSIMTTELWANPLICC